MQKILAATVALLLSASVSDAATMQAVFSGQITEGSDKIGLYGPAGGSLAMREFVISITYDTTQGVRTRQSGGYVETDAVSGRTFGSQPSVSPVDGVSIFTAGLSREFIAAESGEVSLRTFDLGQLSVAFFSGAGTMKVGDTVIDSLVRFQMVSDRRFFVVDLEANQEIDLSDPSLDYVCLREGVSDCRFSFAQDGGVSQPETFGQLSPTKLTITRLDVPVAPVPLPATSVVLSAAIISFCALRRRARVLV